ncbi:hypothetical protein HKK80_02420 [Halonotius sp. F2-221B]|uniref:hypothetical protein n=1 Tax=Halonotius sp. F2-221B TaxID=2731620 RepID=UPI00398ABA83
MASRGILPEPNTTRATSLLMMVAVGVGIWLLTTVTGSRQSLLVAAVAGGVVGLTMLVSDTETPVGGLVASLFAPAVSLLVLVAVLAPIRVLVQLVLVQSDVVGIESILRLAIGQVGVALAAGVATFGVVGTLDGKFGEGGATRLLRNTDTAVLGPMIVLAGVAVVRLDALASMPVLGIERALPTLSALDSPVPAAVLLSFWGVATVFVGVLKLTLGVAPIVELSPQPREAAVAATLTRLNRGLNIGWGVMTLLTLSPVGLAMADLIEIRRFEPVVGVLETDGLRRGLLQVSGLLALMGVILWGLQAATGRVTNAVSRLMPIPVAAASAVAIAVAGGSFVGQAVARVPAVYRPQIEQVVSALTPTGVVLAVIVAAMSLLSVALVVVALGGAIRYVPRRTAGSALASAGLAVGAIAAGVYGAGILVVAGVVAISVFVWSVGEQSVTMRTELDAAASIQLEAVHTISAFGLAGGGIALAWGLSTTALDRLTVADGTLLGVLAAAVGILILVVGIRG